MKYRYLITALLFSANAYALSPEEEEIKGICWKHVRSRMLYMTNGCCLSTDTAERSEYDTGFGSCDEIMAKITKKINLEEIEKTKADLDKVAKFAARK